MQNAAIVVLPTHSPPDAQSVGERQGSPKFAPPVGVMVPPSAAGRLAQSAGWYAQPLAHVPVCGPVPAPLDVTQRAVALHHPQLFTGVQVPQAVFVEHGSLDVVPLSVGGGVAVHSLGSHAKPEPQLPATGPVCVDETHWLVAPHQPQPFTGVQPAHVV